MKSPTPLDIVSKVDRPLTRLSIYSKGKWYFGKPISTPLSTDTLLIYKINQVFGLCNNVETNPARAKVRGKKGDYIGMDKGSGFYSLITKETYDLWFPTRILTRPKPKAISSKVLTQDKNYLTKIYQGYSGGGSNTIVIEDPEEFPIDPESFGDPGTTY